MKRNEHLSKARSEYIFNLLTGKYGIAPDRLVMQSEVIPHPADPTMARSVVIKF